MFIIVKSDLINDLIKNGDADLIECLLQNGFTDFTHPLFSWISMCELKKLAKHHNQENVVAVLKPYADKEKEWEKKDDFVKEYERAKLMSLNPMMEASFLVLEKITEKAKSFLATAIDYASSFNLR